MIKKYNYILFVTLLTTLVMIGCGGGGNDSGGSDNQGSILSTSDNGGTTETGNPVIAGIVQKGPFYKGAKVVIKELDDFDLTPTGVEHTVEVSTDLGEFTVTDTADIASTYVEINATGYYFNEIYGIQSYLPITLSAFADSSVNQKVNVNLLTTIALKREKYLIAQLGKTYEEAKIQARNEVLNLFHFPEEAIGALNFENVETLINMDIRQDGEQNAVLLSVSILLQNFQNTHPSISISHVIQYIGNEIETDGVLEDSMYIESIFKSAAKIDLAEIRTNLEDYYQALTQWFSNPDFEFIYETYTKPYTRMPAPIFNLPSATYNQDITVELYCSTPGSIIYYSVNDSDPEIYLAPIEIADNQTLVHIKAWADINYMEQSLEVSSYYLIDYDYEDDPATYKMDMSIADYRSNMAGTWIGHLDRPQQWLSPDNVKITFDEAGNYSAEKLSFFIESELDIIKTSAYEIRGSDAYYGVNRISDIKAIDINEITSSGKAVADLITLKSDGEARVVGILDNITMSDDLNHLQYEFRCNTLPIDTFTFHLTRMIE